VTLLDDLKNFHLARHELAPRPSPLPSRKKNPHIEQVRKVLVTPPRPADTLEIILRPRVQVAEDAPAEPARIAFPELAAAGPAPALQTHSPLQQSLLYRAGRVWERPVRNPVPAFLGREARRAKIVVVTDVNSGDGKTALVARLGAMLAEQGDQVLMLDLDHRGALTDSCFAPEMRQKLRSHGRTVVRWLEAAGRRGRPLLECMSAVSHNLWAVASDDSLGVWEARERAAWLVQKDLYDVRFRLRGELHGTDICQRFDWILIDCPRRLSTAAINAFACGDYLMLAGSDKTSQAQVSQLLGWLARLNVLTGACRGLSMLGVVSVDDELGVSSKPSAAPSVAAPSVAATSIAAPATPAIDWARAAASARQDRWVDGVYYFGNSVPRVVAPKVAQEAVAAGPAWRPGAVAKGGISPRTSLATEVRQRIAARGKRRKR